MEIRQKIITLVMALIAIITIPSCGSDNDDEPSVYDPAGEIEGTYIGTLDVTNGSNSYHLENASFIIRKESTGSIYYDIIREDGKKLLNNIYATVGYSKDNNGYVLAAVGEDGTISKSGHLHYTGKCSVNGVKGYDFTFNGNKKK